MSNEDLIKHQEEISKKRRIFVQARAIIQRGKKAGIPDKYIRVKEKEFEELLCDKYHNNTKDFANLIYKNPQTLFNKSFIVIDGGNTNSRKKAGFAILFRMIACDNHGQSYSCAELASEFQTLKFSGTENRNDLVRKVKNDQIILINEFHRKQFNVHLIDSGNFFDQLLSHRDDYSKPTIITFTNPLELGLMNQGNAIKDDYCGTYLSMLSHADINKDKNVFRIKLK